MPNFYLINIKTMKTQLTLLLASLFLSTALLGQVERKGDACYVNRVFEDGDLVTQYHFDDNGKLQKSENFEDGQLKSVMEGADYLPDGSPQKVIIKDAEGKVTYKTKLTYNEDQLVVSRKTYKANEDGEMMVVQKADYSYDVDSPCKMTGIKYYDGEGNLVKQSQINYYDDNCSSIGTVTDADGKVLQTETWVRDDKNNPRHAFSVFHVQDEHNRIAYTVVKADGTVTKDSYQMEDVEYNAHGYPVKGTMKMSDGASKTYTMDYECKI